MKYVKNKLGHTLVVRSSPTRIQIEAGQVMQLTNSEVECDEVMHASRMNWVEISDEEIIPEAPVKRLPVFEEETVKESKVKVTSFGNTTMDEVVEPEAETDTVVDNAEPVTEPVTKSRTKAKV